MTEKRTSPIFLYMCPSAVFCVMYVYGRRLVSSDHTMASLLWLLLLTLGVATQASVIIKNSWYGGFEAVIKLRTTSRTSGWRVAMVFSKPVTDLQVIIYALLPSPNTMQNGL